MSNGAFVFPGVNEENVESSLLARAVLLSAEEYASCRGGEPAERVLPI